MNAKTIYAGTGTLALIGGLLAVAGTRTPRQTVEPAFDSERNGKLQSREVPRIKRSRFVKRQVEASTSAGKLQPDYKPQDPGVLDYHRARHPEDLRVAAGRFQAPLSGGDADPVAQKDTGPEIPAPGSR
jgi:hypothetical protein